MGLLAKARAVISPLLAVVTALLLQAGCSPDYEPTPQEARLQQARMGRDLIDGLGCGSCHVIPGASAASGTIGPSLEGFGARAYVAGSLINTPDNLTRWILSPQEIHPGTVMPDLGVTREQAEAISVYLHTLR